MVSRSSLAIARLPFLKRAAARTFHAPVRGGAFVQVVGRSGPQGASDPSPATSARAIWGQRYENATLAAGQATASASALIKVPPSPRQALPCMQARVSGLRAAMRSRTARVLGP